VVGVNKFVEAEDAAAAPEILRVDPDLERAQVERTPTAPTGPPAGPTP
jgi:methylmalonyl-CoA mutase N-terminal domain/subunit